jgi:hypothetical protein
MGKASIKILFMFNHWISILFTYVLIDYELCRYRLSTLALSSILLALRDKGPQWTQFTEDWYSFIARSFDGLIDEKVNCIYFIVLVHNTKMLKKTNTSGDIVNKSLR